MKTPLSIGTAAVLGLGAWLVARAAQPQSARGDTGDPNAPGPIPDISADPNFNAGNLDAWPVLALEPSPALMAWLKGKESLLLQKTDLGDGGFTIGYGHFEPAGSTAAAQMPDAITAAQADQIFANDVQTRAVAQVDKYLNVPLTQNQFDAVTSVAFNLSPSGFATVADAVNAGQGLDPVVYQYVRAGSSFEAGLRARRVAEIAMFDNAVYS